MKSVITLVTILSLATSSAWAQSRSSSGNQQVQVVTTTTVPTVTSTTLGSAASIKDAAVKQQKNAKKGGILATAAIGVASVGVAISCLPKPNPKACPYWVAGLAAGVLVKAMTGKSKNNADQVYNSVAVGDGLCPTCKTAGTPDYDEYGLDRNSNDPETKRIQANLADLKSKGIKLNPANGTFTVKDKTYNLSDYVNEDGSLKKPGADGARTATGFPTSGAGSLSDFNALNSNLKSAVATAVDGNESSAFDENLTAGGGSGKATSVGAADGSGDLEGLVGLPSAEAGGAESDRLPAESVEGLTRRYGDSNIGVASDTLWVLIQRRYKKVSDGGKLLPGTGQ